MFYVFIFCTSFRMIVVFYNCQWNFIKMSLNLGIRLVRPAILMTCNFAIQEAGMIFKIVTV